MSGKNPAAVALGRLGGQAGTGAAKARTSEQARAAVAARWAKTKHVDGVCFLCDDCRQVKPVQTNGGTGYAYLPDGEKPICYDCADKRQIEDLKDRSKPFCAYLGKRVVTTWTGGKLMDVVWSSPCQLTRQSHMHSRNGYMSVRAVDIHGGHWAGRGSEGVAIRLRPVKS